AAWVRRPRPEGGVAAGREDDRGSAKGSERRYPLALGQPDPRVFTNPRRQHVRDVATRVRAARMNDAGARVAAFPTEPLVEADAETPQLRDPDGSLGRQELDGGGPAEAAAGRERVGRVEGGVVVRADRRSDATLSRIAV